VTASAPQADRPDPAGEQITPAGAQPAGGLVPPAAAALPQHKVRRTRIGGVWLATALFAVVLLLLLIFILENGTKAEISYFGAHGHMPLGVALLLAAVFGILLVVIPGTARIVQLRVTARRHRHLDARVVAAEPTATAPGSAADIPSNHP
jgi:uncharacterized integral membrane protein